MRYQIYTRQTGEHREGHLALLIDDQDADVTLDPAQFVEVCTRELLAEGHTPEQVAALLGDRCQARALHCFERKIERLRQGRGGSGIEAGPAAEVSGRKRQKESATVEAFLNRGNLKGLTKLQRKERLLVDDSETNPADAAKPICRGQLTFVAGQSGDLGLT